MVDQVTEQELRDLATSDGVDDAAPVEEGIVDNMLGGDEPVATTEQLEQAEAEAEAEAAEATAPATDAEPAATPNAQPEPVTEDAGEPKTVPLAALHEEREKHRTLRDDPEALQRRLTELRAAQAPAAPPATPVTESPPPAVVSAPELKMPEWGKSDPNDVDPRTTVENDDLDIMSNSELESHRKNCSDFDRREDSRHQQISTEMDNQRIDVDGRRRFTVQSEGVGFDYDTVMRTGGGHLTRDDIAYIRVSLDKSKAVYNLCIERCPSLKFMKEHPAKPTANPPPNTPANVQPQAQPDTDAEPEEEPRMTIDANDRTPDSIMDSLEM